MGMLDLKESEQIELEPEQQKITVVIDGATSY